MEPKLRAELERQVKRGSEAFVFLLSRVPTDLRCYAISFVMHSLNIGIGINDEDNAVLTEIGPEDIEAQQREKLN